MLGMALLPPQALALWSWILAMSYGRESNKTALSRHGVFPNLPPSALSPYVSNKGYVYSIWSSMWILWDPATTSD